MIRGPTIGHCSYAQLPAPFVSALSTPLFRWPPCSIFLSGGGWVMMDPSRCVCPLVVFLSLIKVLARAALP